ncbi:hypothetical protein CFC21_056166 [Triticum aestivum]|uniref:Pectinesterase inhibitor domain-containing protein n=3 Tax=Triticum TaxID=4564 RepID=A0A9R1KAU2_WHEAT|nr:hypothetical protein CFC21_056164 [Triticum aestivum]KAF7047219.1 hypothetical protein CFC21_056166 [Triticum aestivum]VAI00933.1 unnamed protein product [Triticum turgidum subsp. durum]
MDKTGALSLTLLFLFVAGAEADKCKDVRATSTAACRQASTSKLLYDICVQMLAGSPDRGDVRSHALTAAGAVLESYAATGVAINKMLRSGSDRMKEAMLFCTQYYYHAQIRFKEIKTLLEDNSDCDLKTFEAVYSDAIMRLDDCRSKMIPIQGESPSMYGMIYTDGHRSFLAFRLGLLVANP